MAGGTRAYRPITVTSQPIDGPAEGGLPINEPDVLGQQLSAFGRRRTVVREDSPRSRP